MFRRSSRRIFNENISWGPISKYVLHYIYDSHFFLTDERRPIAMRHYNWARRKKSIPPKPISLFMNERNKCSDGMLYWADFLVFFLFFTTLLKRKWGKQNGKKIFAPQDHCWKLVSYIPTSAPWASICLLSAVYMTSVLNFGCFVCSVVLVKQLNNINKPKFGVNKKNKEEK